jgi:hypothetical protein
MMEAGPVEDDTDLLDEDEEMEEGVEAAAVTADGDVEMGEVGGEITGGRKMLTVLSAPLAASNTTHADPARHMFGVSCSNHSSMLAAAQPLHLRPVSLSTLRLYTRSPP